MRPKKCVLLVSPDEQRLSEMQFMLTVNGYAVRGASSSSEALAILGEAAFDCAVVQWPIKDGAEMLGRLKSIHPPLPVMVLAHSETTYPAGVIADAVLLGRIYPSELLDRLKVISARKRGPHKKPPVSVAPEDIPAAEPGIAALMERTA